MAPRLKSHPCTRASCLAATSCVGATLTMLATASIIDADHRLRPERLTKQTRGRKLEHRIQEALYAVRPPRAGLNPKKLMP
jgi:hypothetical protein